MTDTSAKISIGQLAALAVLALGGGFAGAAAWDIAGLGQGRRDAAVREYIMANPEVLPDAMRELQAKQQRAALAPARPQLEHAFPGAVLGNPKGKITLVEFSDYACTYCRQSVADVEQLIRQNPDLRVVIREYPILTEQSAEAARMALAAAEQGKYAAFHAAMFELGPPSPQTIEAAATKAGMDLPKAREAIASGRYDAELSANVALARQLGFDGTPAFVIGDAGFNGAVGLEALSKALAEAKAGGKES